MPLQNYTSESYQVSHSEQSEVSEVGPCLHYSNSHSLVGTQFDTNSWGLKDLASYMDNWQSLVCNDQKCSADGYLSNRRAYPDKRIVNGESGFQVQEEAEANVHLGAPPPWFDATEENPLNSQLYPKQMGAAWEEKRKIEMERKGEIVTNNFDMEVNDTFGVDHVKRITDGLDFEPLDLTYWFILNSRLDGAIILFVMRGKIMDGFSLKLSS
ncbi:TITAN-like protein [Camellia lanceoleosa]|uniref:TITAN-like protein n=1 Tax=Camellia lanceoleosa TaxID=1840588 RepID=A0ACC0GGK7_9ERIC|nr:TITAN-like protein [Camellia lanceoleosa]